MIPEWMDQYVSMAALNITWSDVVEILILAFIIYHVMIWIKSTRAWSLMKGSAVLFALLILAYVFHMNTILWIAKNFFSLGIMAVIVVFQPELRRALEQLGENNLLTSIVPFDNSRKVEETLTDRTIGELVKACFEMGKARTGALIVLEQAVSLQEYERTGISIDSLVSSQLILNIFEKNTPLHDGAVIMSGNRIRSATCYLPLSDNMTLSKALGTRHRAAVGVSEVSDSLTIVVSEETGSVSVARGGRLLRNLNQEQLKKQLQALQQRPMTAARSGSGKDGERMKAKIFDNLLFKILALLMAVLLWVVVVNIDDAVSYKKISGVKVNLINTDVLTSQDQTIRVEEGSDIVNLTVYARSSVLKSLKAEDFSATADVKKDLLYDNMVKIGVSYVGSLPSSSIQKIEQDRSNVLVSIEKQVTEQFKVTAKYTGEPSDGLVLGSLASGAVSGRDHGTGIGG